ncbi:hypothetical protein DE4576_04648 [Mycobacterium marinum]|nr:hypothetical protein DE4576_04648 [Mycobacterium marinum]
MRAGYVPLRLRRESYQAELGHLSFTYEVARHRETSDLRDALQGVIALPAWYVGNGGTMAVANYAAVLHNYRTGRPAFATTSLGYITSRVAAQSAVVVFSAGAKHPDTSAAVQAAIERRVSEIVVVTERERDELTGVLADPRVQVISLNRPGPRDGFLATNSIMNMATAVAVAHLGARSLPDHLPSLQDDTNFEVRQGDDLVILASSSSWGAAIDLETRLVETGVAAVQTTDYRNFAHGRHLGLSRNQDRTTVVAFTDKQTKSLSQMTTEMLPAEIPVITVSSALDEPISCLDLLGQSMRLFGSVAGNEDLDPARPQVPGFGRRLYNLKSRQYVGRTPLTHPAVLRKLEAAAVPLDPPRIDAYTTALRRWLRKADQVPISSVLLDYDGTVCTTEGRFDPPAAKVSAEILRLLKSGVQIGFASGRGRSLPEGLRSWIPSDLQDKVYVGMYNGSVNTRLIDELSLPDEGPFTSSKTRTFLNSLKDRVGADGVVTVRPFQVSVHADRVVSSILPALRVAVAEAVASYNSNSDSQLKAVASAHSLDIVLASTSKNSLRRCVAEPTKQVGQTLAIGDQGGFGGNDFELLSATPLSLSVDEVSGDPTRCWNLEAGAHSGPSALIKYLQAVRRDRSRVLSFRWSMVWQQ